MSYEEWMKKVDAQLMNLVGLESTDLGDYSYADAFEGEEDPYEVALAVLEYNDFDVENL